MEKKFFYIEDYGCSANQNNGEIIRGILLSRGLEETTNPEIADFLIINTCIVKGPTENKMRRRIKELLEKKKPLIVAGCMANVRREELQKIENVYLLSTNNITKIAKLIFDIENKKYDIHKYISNEKEIKLCLPKIRKNKIIGITQISEGCVGACKFCITKLAKGNLFSYPEEIIIESIKRDLESGCKEIWITSQDNAAYGLDRGERALPHLLNKILSIKKKFYVRVGMMNPNNLFNILEDIIEIYKNEKMFKFLHIPLQSGSDKVLKEMNRFYCVEDFLYIIKKFKKEIPNITISTDIIVAYPTETDEDFKETIKIIKKVRPDIINISKYWPMKGTEAAKFKLLPSEIVKKRVKEIVNLHLKISEENNKRFEKKEEICLIDEYKNKNYIARNIFYKPIVIKTKEKNLFGKYVKVKIIKAFPHYLLGKIIKKRKKIK